VRQEEYDGRSAAKEERRERIASEVSASVPLSARLKTAWRMLRPFTLTASLVPTLVGSALALTVGGWHWGLFVAFLVAAVLIQAATNMWNEYFDYARGLDDEKMVGIAGAIVRDQVPPRVVLYTAYGFVAVALGLGLYISASTSWWVAVTGAACLLVAYGYSGGPKPLSSTPFGELAAALAMGPAIVILAFYVQARTVAPAAVLVSVPVGLLIGAILLANNLRDMELDRAGGRRTLPIVLGRPGGIRALAAVFTLAYLFTLGLAVWRVVPVWAVFVLATVPQAVRVVGLYLRHTDPPDLHPAVKGTSMLLLSFGLLLFLAILAGRLVG